MDGKTKVDDHWKAWKKSLKNLRRENRLDVNLLCLLRKEAENGLETEMCRNTERRIEVDCKMSQVATLVAQSQRRVSLTAKVV